jgi:hypothetical protein
LTLSGNHQQEIEDISQDLSPTSTTGHANALQIADGDHRDHPFETHERTSESAIEVVNYSWTREARIRPDEEISIRYRANVERVEAHLYLVHITRSQGESLRGAQHDPREHLPHLHAEIRDVEPLHQTHPADGRLNVLNQTIV